jgi:DNA-binding protein HU-beta
MIIGMPITKDEQVQAVAAATGLSNKQARYALDATVALVVAGLRADGKITLHGLGMFEKQRRSERRVRNPSTGVMMDVPAKTVIKFKPSSALRALVEVT